MESCGYSLKVIHICGGLSNNDLYVQAHADITGMYYVGLIYFYLVNLKSCLNFVQSFVIIL